MFSLFSLAEGPKKVIKKPRGARKEIDIKNIIDNTGPPIRQSRRIAQLKIKEEAERRKLEEIALKKMKSDFKRQKHLTDGTNVLESSQSDQEDHEQEDDTFVGKLVKKKNGSEKKKKKGSWSSGSDEQDEEDDDQHFYGSDKSIHHPLKSDHEFSPESDIEDSSQIVPMKRARTVRKEGDLTSDNNTENDEACIKCGKTDHPEWILLCDKCDKGYHCSCLSPVLFYIPEGAYF